jgi:hypothetical protein
MFLEAVIVVPVVAGVVPIAVAVRPGLTASEAHETSKHWIVLRRVPDVLEPCAKECRCTCVVLILMGEVWPWIGRCVSR